LHYHGLDASESLLATLRARALPFARVETTCSDLIETPISEILEPRSFSLVAAFGLLHHVPAERNRRALLRALAASLAPGGLLAFAVWRFEAFERFRARARPWAEHNAHAENPIPEDQLEHGDSLMPWGEDGRAVRYCHFANDAEVERWLASLPLDAVARYDADGREGRLNRYFVLRMKGAA
jgi:SAM-dependent methyltransferase